MVTIKRYPNRKLYDTEAKQYIKLDGIAELIRQGKEVRVIDNASGDDLTTLTLTQIILEQEKKQSGILSNSVLTGLIRASEDRLTNLQRGLRSPFNFLHQVDEEIRQRIQTLVKLGELPEKEGFNLLEKLLSLGQKSKAGSPASEQDVEQEVEQILAERNIPSRADLENLRRQLELLTSKLDEINQDKNESE